jgi:hypothetical protein
MNADILSVIHPARASTVLAIATIQVLRPISEGKEALLVLVPLHHHLLQE